MTPEQYEQFRILTKTHNIHFDGPVERREWPSNYENIFLDVQKLGTAIFEEYCESSVIDSLDKPWRTSTRRRAKRLAALANLCRRERRNEAGWRMLVEPEVMARFTIEVACPCCRKRLWRSEIEVTLDDKDASLGPLERRRRTRVACTCVSVTRGEDCLERGLNPLFSDRAQEVILHDAVLRSVLPKQEQPDRVYGLQSTNNFERLLKALSNRAESHFTEAQDEKDLKTSPFRQDGDPLLFPFLVLEAKSEKGQDSFGSIEMQTAFSIRTLLKIQADLYSTVGKQPTRLGAPLVWFFASKGEEWRVSAGYTATREQTSHYHVIDIWNGRITRKDDSLRLLLIIDYVFDWARDLYRPTILEVLKALVARDTASLAGDSDIFSMVDQDRQVQSWINQSQSDNDPVLEIRNEQDSGIPQSLLALDSEHGVIRHASSIQSRLFGLYITSNSLESLLLSFQTPAKAQKFTREVLKAMKQCWRANADTLEALEVKWTGNYREREESYDSEKTFYVAFALTAYMSPLWDQVREFSYLAVAEDAVDLLLGQADFVKAINIVPQEHPIVGLQSLEDFCDNMRSASIVENLCATMSSASLAGKATNETYLPRWTVEKTSGLTLGFKPDEEGQIRRIVSTIYTLHIIGRREPSEPFLRISKRNDRQSQEAISPNVWPLREAAPTFKDGVALIGAHASSAKVKVPEWCYYIVDGPFELSDVWNIIRIVQEALDNRFIFEVAFRDAKPEPIRWPQDKYTRAVVPMSHIYRHDFTKWLDHLTDLAKKATSPRISSPVQVMQDYPEIDSTSRPATPRADEAQDDTTGSSPTTSVGLGPAQATGSRKRHSDAIDEADGVDPQPSKRQETTFDSDYLTDEVLQQLLDGKHFGEASTGDEPELVE